MRFINVSIESDITSIKTIFLHINTQLGKISLDNLKELSTKIRWAIITKH